MKKKRVSREDVIDILIAISIISRRLARKLNNDMKEETDNE